MPPSLLLGVKNRFNSSAYKKWAEAQGYELEGTCQRKKRKVEEGDGGSGPSKVVVVTVPMGASAGLTAAESAAAALAAADSEDAFPPNASAPVSI